MTFNARNLRALGNRIGVSIPRDDEGYLGRECPHSDCLGYFKIRPGTGLKGTDLPCHCPYCGHTGSHQTFWTPAQVEYAKSVAMQQIAQAVRKDLKQLEFEHKPRGPFGIGISMKLKPGAPVPIRYYREEQLETHVTCAACTLDYAVYGVFGYCPDCRTHNSFQILERNLALIDKQIAVAGTLDDAELRRHLIEDALENCVSSFDGFARETARIAATRRGVAKASYSFQNLARANATLLKHFNIDWASAVEPTSWRTAVLGFMRRHLIAHRAGVVDQQYREETGDTAAQIGRRIRIDEAQVREVAAAVRALGQSLADLLA
jgi:hypothetical protein